MFRSALTEGADSGGLCCCQAAPGSSAHGDLPPEKSPQGRGFLPQTAWLAWLMEAEGGDSSLGGSPEKLQCDGAPGLRFHALPPELELRVDGAMEQEVLTESFRVKRTNRGVVADLLGYEPEP